MIQIDIDMPKNCISCVFYKRIPVGGSEKFKKQFKELIGVDYAPECDITGYCLGNSDNDVKNSRGYGCPLHETEEVVKEAERRIAILKRAIKECYEKPGKLYYVAQNSDGRNDK